MDSNDSSLTNQKDGFSYSLNLTNQDSYVRLVHEKNKTIASLQAVPSPSCAHFDFPSLLRPATQTGCFVVHVRRTRKGERREHVGQRGWVGGCIPSLFLRFRLHPTHPFKVHTGYISFIL